MHLIGRKQEIETLEKMYLSDSSEFLALYGRRRVGKTVLIRSLLNAKTEDAFTFDITGAKNAPMKEQIQHFTIQLGKAFYHGARLQDSKNWDDAFAQLTKAIEDQVPQHKKVILFFDELPWLATPRSRVLAMLDYYWNQYWSRDPRIKLIICGSSASWIINKVIQNPGGLHNRVTREIHLEPFNLSQTKVFLHHQKINLNHQHIVQIYMLTGGIPFYLSKIERGLSANQIIENLAFSKTGFFLQEFEKLFSSLFDNSEDYITLVKLLSKNRYGLGERNLLETLGKKTVGAKGKKILNDLEQTGFIMRFIPLYNKRKGTYYRLTDEYTLFYLKWIEPFKNSLIKNTLDSDYFQTIQASAEWHSWQGYAFESICYKHLLNIRKALKLDPRALPSTWRYVPQKKSKHHGAQIDLLFDRQDDSITLCEIKYSKKPFILTKEVVDSLFRKISVFKERTKTKKQIFVALITASGLKNNYYADDIISNIVTIDDLFNNQ